MLFGIFFAFWRFMEIITLIPTMGMLAYFVHLYASINELTPTYILVLFIVSVLGVVWTIFTLFTYHRSRSNSQFVAFVDMLFVGALIAAVYELRWIGGQNCTTITSGGSYTGYFGVGSVTVNGIDVNVRKQCAMLKASWAFGIMNTIFFALTALAAFMVGGGSSSRRKETYVSETHYSRHGHRRSGSHRSHRSSHAGRRHAYV